MIRFLNFKNLILLTVVAVYLYMSPYLDITLAKLSFDPVTHSFYGEHSRLCHIIYLSVPYIVIMLLILPLTYFIYSIYIVRTRLIQAQRFFVIVTLSLILGPGLIINVTLKDHWGRARPTQVLKDKQSYTPIWHHDFTKTKDNSFPSGHGSVGFFLGVPILALGYRRSAIITSIIGGAIVGGVRMLQGGHYFSDVVFAGIIVWLCTCWIIYIYDKYLFKVIK